jgi:hypothetical protein
MGMGHRMQEKQVDDYVFKGPNDEYDPGFGILFIYFYYFYFYFLSFGTG